MQTPDDPPLCHCPFCGRPAPVATHRAATGQPVTQRVGCFKSTDPTVLEPYSDGCLGPRPYFLADLGRAVELWKTRGRPAGRG